MQSESDELEAELDLLLQGKKIEEALTIINTAKDNNSENENENENEVGADSDSDEEYDFGPSAAATATNTLTNAVVSRTSNELEVEEVDGETMFGEGIGVEFLWAKKGKQIQSSTAVKKKLQRSGLTAGKRLPPTVTGPLADAHTHFINGEYKKAIDMLSEVRKRAPRLPDSYHTMGLIYEKYNDPEKALTMFILAATHTPKNPGLWKKIAVMSLDQGNENQAMIALNKVAKSAEPDPFYAAQKLLLLIKTNRLSLAISSLRHFLTRFPAEMEILPDFALACQQQGR